jgi:hypothetical protein
LRRLSVSLFTHVLSGTTLSERSLALMLILRRAVVPRDRHFERLFLEEVVEHAAVRFGIRLERYVPTVLSRLEKGRRRYGDTAYLRPEWNGMREISQETADIAGYAVLALQRVLGEPGYEEFSDCIFEAVIHAIAAEGFVRRAYELDNIGELLG